MHLFQKLFKFPAVLVPGVSFFVYAGGRVYLDDDALLPLDVDVTDTVLIATHVTLRVSKTLA